MRRIVGLCIVVLGGCGAMPAAAQAQRPVSLLYRATYATVAIDMTFAGSNPAGTCGPHCAGTAHYRFAATDHDPFGDLTLHGRKRRHEVGGVTVRGTSTVSVAGVEGSPPCTYGRTRDDASDSVRFSGVGSRVVVQEFISGAGFGFFSGACGAPPDPLIGRPEFMPATVVQLSTFRRRRFTLHVHQTRPFAIDGWSGTISGDIVVHLKRCTRRDVCATGALHDRGDYRTGLTSDDVQPAVLG
jgi:hypothetical protein